MKQIEERASIPLRQQSKAGRGPRLLFPQQRCSFVSWGVCVWGGGVRFVSRRADRSDIICSEASALQADGPESIESMLLSLQLSPRRARSKRTGLACAF